MLVVLMESLITLTVSIYTHMHLSPLHLFFVVWFQLLVVDHPFYVAPIYYIILYYSYPVLIGPPLFINPLHAHEL